MRTYALLIVAIVAGCGATLTLTATAAGAREVPRAPSHSMPGAHAEATVDYDAIATCTLL